MHRLLKRQIKKYLDHLDIDQSQLDDFIQAVETAYMNFDSDYKQIENTLEISSKESFKELSDFRNAINTTVMVIITDYQGRITYVNDQFVEASGFAKEELLYNSISKFNSDFHDADFYKNMSQIITKGEIWKGEIREKNKNGTYYWVDTTIVPLLNKLGKPFQYIIFKLNISKIKNTEREYLLAKEEAEKALEIKAEFLSNMSHEIRTPMNAIIGLTDIVLQEPLSDMVKDNLKSIKQSADNLLVIINDILDFSKIEAGKVKMEQISFNFLYQMEHIDKTMAFKSAQKNIDFFVIIDKNIPEFLVGDPFRLNQIILNLCSNAIKFTQQGFVNVIVNLLDKDDKKAKLHFMVEDSGIGISPNRQKSIFDSFTQADIKVTREFGGTGLGLTITRQLIQLMGGEIKVESQLGKGSKFFFDLDFDISEEQTETLENNTLHEKCLAGLNILVMEDNLINQKVISQILAKWNCELSIADNGLIGIDYLKKYSFDIILMDLQMPIMDGFQAVKAIRSGEAGINNLRIPIIALTADAFPETKQRVLEWGMNDLVSKPFKKTILNDRIFQMARSYCPEKLTHIGDI